MPTWSTHSRVTLLTDHHRRWGRCCAYARHVQSRGLCLERLQSIDCYYWQRTGIDQVRISLASKIKAVRCISYEVLREGGCHLTYSSTSTHRLPVNRALDTLCPRKIFQFRVIHLALFIEMSVSQPIESPHLSMEDVAHKALFDICVLISFRCFENNSGGYIFACHFLPLKFSLMGKPWQVMHLTLDTDMHALCNIFSLAMEQKCPRKGWPMIFGKMTQILRPVGFGH